MPKQALAQLEPKREGQSERQPNDRRDDYFARGQADGRAARILARSLFRDMRSNGYGPQQILGLATELIDLVTQEMRGEGEPGLPPEPTLTVVSKPFSS
ncbi:MAG: hypothetical protein ACYCWW_12925 [Deltaproteobacteria bacterium]